METADAVPKEPQQKPKHLLAEVVRILVKEALQNDSVDAKKVMGDVLFHCGNGVNQAFPELTQLINIAVWPDGNFNLSVSQANGPPVERIELLNRTLVILKECLESVTKTRDSELAASSNQEAAKPVESIQEAPEPVEKV